MRCGTARVVMGTIYGAAVLGAAGGCRIGKAADATGATGAAAPPTGTVSSAAPSATPTLTPTRWGPLSKADEKLMTIVRQTSLREITTSRWAEQRSANPRVRQAAQVIIKQHLALQRRDLAIASRMGMRLPAKPSTDMQAGIDRMRNERGRTFDLDYVNTLRQAHAQALILISTVRADTRNSLVRPFAGTANDFIKTHIEVLERTGDVDYTKLPVPRVP